MKKRRLEPTDENRSRLEPIAEALPSAIRHALELSTRRSNPREVESLLRAVSAAGDLLLRLEPDTA